MIVKETTNVDDIKAILCNQDIYDTISEIAERTFPAVTIIPEPVGASGFASKVIKDAMLKAVGTDVTAR